MNRIGVAVWILAGWLGLWGCDSDAEPYPGTYIPAAANTAQLCNPALTQNLAPGTFLLDLDGQARIYSQAAGHLVAANYYTDRQRVTITAYDAASADSLSISLMVYQISPGITTPLSFPLLDSVQWRQRPATPPHAYSLLFRNIEANPQFSWQAATFEQYYDTLPGDTTHTFFADNYPPLHLCIHQFTDSSIRGAIVATYLHREGAYPARTVSLGRFHIPVTHQIDKKPRDLFHALGLRHLPDDVQNLAHRP